MKITNKLALEYINKNRKRSFVIVIRYYNHSDISNNCIYSYVKLSVIYGEYS